MLERLQKIIARAGIASRRHAEQLILAGEVAVNGAVVTTLGAKADPERDHIQVAGRRLRFPAAKTYLVLHKPAGCVATMSDPEGRKTLRDFLPGVRGRVFPVGRLDYHASGLLLLTNDGELANQILAARRRGGLAQTYWIKVKGRLAAGEFEQLRQRAGARIRLVKDAPNPWYEVTLIPQGGTRRDLRRSLLELGHPVEKVQRVRLANLELGALPPGRYRYLTADEVARLERAVAQASKTAGKHLLRGKVQKAETG